MNYPSYDPWQMYSRQAFDTIMGDLARAVDRAILEGVARVLPEPVITQEVTYRVNRHWLPAGWQDGLVLNNLSLFPRIGDLIEFGDQPNVYTIIELLRANNLNPWTIVLDRPLEHRLRCDRKGLVTESIIVRRRMNSRFPGPPYGVAHFFEPLLGKPLK